MCSLEEAWGSAYNDESSGNSQSYRRFASPSSWQDTQYKQDESKQKPPQQPQQQQQTQQNFSVSSSVGEPNYKAQVQEDFYRQFHQQRQHRRRPREKVVVVEEKQVNCGDALEHVLGCAQCSKQLGRYCASLYKEREERKAKQKAENVTVFDRVQEFFQQWGWLVVFIALILGLVWVKSSTGSKVVMREIGF